MQSWAIAPPEPVSDVIDIPEISEWVSYL